MFLCIWNFITFNLYLWNYDSSDIQKLGEISFSSSLHKLKIVKGNAFEMIKYLVFYGCFTNRYHLQALYKNYDFFLSFFFFFLYKTFHSWRGFICRKKKLKQTFMHSQKKV